MISGAPILLSLLVPLVGHAQGSRYINPFSVGGTSIDNVPQALFTLVDAFLLILAPIAVVMIIYAGFLFVTAQGNEAKLTLAKKTLLWSVVGLILILGTKVLATAIQATICELSAGSPFCVP